MTAIIITTKFYPYSNGWSDLSLVGRLDYKNPNFFSFKLDESRKEFTKSPSMKWVDLGDFRIYVCPCMAETVDARQMAAIYLDEVIGTAQYHLGQHCDFDDDFFLVAHDKDFVLPNGETEADGVVAEKHHFTNHLADCSCLSRLVENRHVYMFKHGHEHKLGKMINTEKLNLEKKDCLSMDDCYKMLSIIVKEIEMSNFFRDLAKTSNCVYPQKK